MSSHERTIAAVMVFIALAASVIAVGVISDESDGATDLGTLYVGTDENESGPDALYSSVTGAASDYRTAGTIYVTEGAHIMIHSMEASPDWWVLFNADDAAEWGLSKTETGDSEGNFWSGDLNQVGELELSINGESTVFSITFVVQYAEEISIDSVGGTEATVGYEYRYDVQTTPSNAEIFISGADWLDVSGHTISGTPDEVGDYTLVVTANLDGYLAATETVRIHVSEEQTTVGVPELGEIYYNVSSGNPYSLTFHVSAENASTIRWDFGDGNISSTGADVTHTYSNSGSYTVRATATNSEGSVTKSVDILIADRSPATTVQYNHAYSYTVGIDTDGLTPTVSGCPFLTVTDGGNHVTVSGTPSSTSYVGQTYDVVLTVGEFSMSWKLTVTEGSTVPVAGFDVKVDGLKVTVTSTASNADMTFYQWIDGGSFVQSNTGTTEYTYSEPGTYTITQRVTATVDGQTVTDEFSRTVTVDGGSTPDPTPEPEEDSLIPIIGIALAVLGIIVLASGAYTRNYIIATVGAVLVILGAVIWWMS